MEHVLAMADLKLKPSLFTPRPSTHMLRHPRMCRPHGLIFPYKSSDMCPILVKKSLEEGPISQKL